MRLNTIAALAQQRSPEQRGGSQYAASQQNMRTFIRFVIAVGIGGAVLLQKQREQAPPASTTKRASAAARPAGAPIEQPSQQNWPKRALDRAANVKRQAAEQRKQTDGS